MNRLPRPGFVIVKFFIVWAVLTRLPATPQSLQPASQAASIHYIVSLANRAEHLVRVKIVLGPGASERNLQLPVWNALYQVRDFSDYVNWVTAKTASGQPLSVRKVDKATWHLSGMEQGAEVEYQLLSDQSGPFGAQLNTHHAFFNLAEILMYPAEGRSLPTEVSIHRLAHWVAHRNGARDFGWRL